MRQKSAGSYGLVVALFLAAAAIGIVTVLRLGSTIADVDAILASEGAAGAAVRLTQDDDVAGAAVVVIAVFVGTGVLVAMAVAYLSVRDILQGVRSAEAFARAVARGELAEPARLRTQDEFEDMGRALEETSSYLREVEGFARQVADGDLEARIEPRSRRDRLGHALQAMADALREVVAANARAEAEAQTEASRRHMLTLISHEFRTPLGLIKGSLSSLRDPRASLRQETQRELIGIAESEADRLTQMVEDARTATHMVPGEITLERSDVDIAELVRDMITEYQAVHPAREFRVSDSPGPILAHVDARRIRHALAHLFDNAIAYSPAQEPIEFEVEAADGQIAVTVRDQGIGIAPETQERIFETFARGDIGPESAIHGQGLGLSIVRSIAVAHGGDVTVRSKLGAGSEFTLCLPPSAEGAGGGVAITR